MHDHRNTQSKDSRRPIRSSLPLPYCCHVFDPSLKHAPKYITKTCGSTLRTHTTGVCFAKQSCNSRWSSSSQGTQKSRTNTHSRARRRPR